MQDSMMGRFLGQYELLKLIGKGGMARVYKSIQPALERYVAVKVLHPSVAADEEFLVRFQREAKAAASLRHSHIVQIFDFGHQDELYYMVMELIDGPTLRDELYGLRARGETLSVGEVQRIIGEVSDALDYAHGRGIIHRDVKPANILLTPDRQAVLSDFGLAFMIEGTRQTITGFVGTPEYMSPEQGQGLVVDGRTDVYSLGVVLYEMLTGRVPFSGKTPMGTVMKHISEPLPPPRSVNPDIPEGVERVLLKAMAKNPKDRYNRAGELSRALAEAFEASAVVETAAAIPVAIPERIPEAVEEPEAELECARCGARLSPDLRFCRVCGTPVSERQQPPAPPMPIPEPPVTTVEKRRPGRSKLSLLIAVLGVGLLAVIVVGVTVVVAAILKGPSTGEPTVVGGGGTVISRASDTPFLTPIGAQLTATAVALFTPTASATASPSPTTPIQATSTPAPMPTTPAPTATPTQQPIIVRPTPEPTNPPPITNYYNMIVFKSDREGEEAFYVMNPDGSGQRRLDDESVYRNALALEAISPDGQWMLEVREIDGNLDIYKIDIGKTQSYQQITSNAADDHHGVWSPTDMNRMAFVSARMGSTDIWTQNVTLPFEEKQLTDNPDYDKHPSWSPDGSQIVYWAVHGGGPRQIWVMNADGGNKRNISNNDYNDQVPVWVKRP